MGYTKLGGTGLEVSGLCLGCSHGAPDLGSHPWSLGEEDSRPFIRRALESGINFFDTANVYSDGDSEQILGRALAEEEREMLPLCADQGVGVLPWSPLARGRLTRDRDEVTGRSRSDRFGTALYGTSESDRVIVERVAQIARTPGCRGRRSHWPGWSGGRV